MTTTSSMTRHLRADTPERIFGSQRFIAMTRNPALQSPVRFKPTEKKEGDITI